MPEYKLNKNTTSPGVSRIVPPGRYVARVIGFGPETENSKGVFRKAMLQIITYPGHIAHGRRIDRVLWINPGNSLSWATEHFINAVDPDSDGLTLNTERCIDQYLEIEVIHQVSRNGNLYANIRKTLPYVKPVSHDPELLKAISDKTKPLPDHVKLAKNTVGKEDFAPNIDKVDLDNLPEVGDEFKEGE